MSGSERDRRFDDRGYERDRGRSRDQPQDYHTVGGRDYHREAGRDHYRDQQAGYEGGSGDYGDYGHRGGGDHSRQGYGYARGGGQYAAERPPSPRRGGGWDDGHRDQGPPPSRRGGYDYRGQGGQGHPPPREMPRDGGYRRPGGQGPPQGGYSGGQGSQGPLSSHQPAGGDGYHGHEGQGPSHGSGYGSGHAKFGRDGQFSGRGGPRGRGGRSGRGGRGGRSERNWRFSGLEPGAPSAQEWSIGLSEEPGLFTPVQIPRRNTAYPAETEATGELTPISRPGYGTEGRQVNLIANHFKVNLRPGVAVYYDVDISYVDTPFTSEGELAHGLLEPPRQPRDRKPLTMSETRDIFREMSRTEGTRLPVGIAYDGRKILFCPGRLPQELANTLAEGVQVVISSGRRTSAFMVVIKEVAVVDLSELLAAGQRPMQKAVQALDVALRHRVSMIRQVQQIGRSLFLPVKNHMERLVDGTVVCQGYQQTLHKVEAGLTVAMDLSFTTFIEEMGAVEYMIAIAGASDAEDLLQKIHHTPGILKELGKAIRHVCFETIHLRKGPQEKIKAKGLGRPAADETFSLRKENRVISVADYFHEQHHRLRYPQLPCIIAGTKKKPQSFPPEVCRIVPGQRTLKTLKDAQKALLPQFCTAPPHKAKELMQYCMTNLASFGQDPTVKAFGMDVERNMLRLKGRILDPPQLAYNGGLNRITPADGKWNLRNLKFMEGAKLESWAVVYTSMRSDDRVRAVDDYVRAQTSMLATCGLSVPRHHPRVHFYQIGGPKPLEAVMREAADEASRAYKHPCQLILVIKPDKGAAFYREIKTASDHDIGIPSQCVVADNINIDGRGQGTNPQYLANVAMKINAKLKGLNTATADGLPKMDLPCMVLGADVTHPNPGAGNLEPSIAAVVGSLDHHAGRYAGRVLRQEHRVETITNLREAVKDLTRQWLKYNEELGLPGIVPERVFYYRDGVADNTFKDILLNEWVALKQAFKEIWAELQTSNQEPLITFVVVQKRHGTRFFPDDPQAADENGNVKPGTIVDRDVTLSHGFDFFLNAHKALQGTSRPTHYHVLLDENRFTADEIQTLTYRLCFLQCRATKSVAVVPPVYYAHLAAFRGRCLLQSSDSASDASFGSNTAPEFCQVHENLQGTMFWV